MSGKHDVKIHTDYSEVDGCTYYHLTIDGWLVAGHAFMSFKEAEDFARSWCIENLAPELQEE
jgi:hypothetical protein